MHASFTGSARRPRQVNLSGRTNPNPFAKPGVSGSPSNAVANAQQNRIARQHERHRAQAATSVQRVWRGYSARLKFKAQERDHWDAVDAQHQSSAPQQLLFTQLIRLLRFFDPALPQDCSRLERLFSHIQAIAKREQLDSNQWSRALLRLENACLSGLARAPANRSLFARLLVDIVKTIPDLTAKNSPAFYHALRQLEDLNAIPLELLLAPLSSLNSTAIIAYQSLALHLLTLPDLRHRLGGQAKFSNFAGTINCKVLTAAVAHMLKEDPDLKLLRTGEQKAKDQAIARLWLLGHLIYLNRHVFDFQMPAEHASGQDYMFVVAHLLSSVADDISIEPPLEGEGLGPKSATPAHNIVEPFLAEQLSSLVNQDSIGGLTSSIGLEDGLSKSTSATTAFQENTHSRVLAGFILTLLRLFPRRSDDIRMWLYLGPSAKQSRSRHGGTSIIQFFWQGVQATRIFSEIFNDPRTAVTLLKANPGSSLRGPPISRDVLEDEWRVVLLFVELYSFVLKVMDDEEFFAQSIDEFSLGPQKVVRSNSLSFDDLRRLSTFLKHLGFTMYYNASDILGSREEESAKDVASLFKSAPVTDPVEPRDKSRPTTCIPGIGLDHMKGAVTGLLRALYERDSRRPFMPKDHWLMISRFDMTNFIDAVVEEEERRNRVQEAEDDQDEEDDDETDDLGSRPLVGTGHAQRVMKIEQQRRQQRKQSRARYLQAVAPRLEILQNMPFLIPFTTRVQIFRRFVHMDQIKRRDGTVDPEIWRMSQMHGMDPLRQFNMERHHAKVRRGHEFEDAFEQFYELGAGLKEPINITFVDQFEQPEAGIDGGGVTKEFLTSVSNQAFAQDGDQVKLFIENDKNLIYPNPNAIEELKEHLRENGYLEGSNMFRTQITDLLQRYEFLGRIIGKCLYEGILVDIGFAGFFLLKWALTGGTGVAPKESGYRANLNDLRDYDQGLYQGLIQLKNYTGDVTEDFSLNFTVTDTLSLPMSYKIDKPHTKTVTSDLTPNGSQQPVTNASRLVYISYMARHRLTKQPFAQTSAFLRGLGTMVPAAWLSMFNQTELQTLVGGAQTSINIPDLRAHTIYGGLYVIGDDGQEHDSVRIFWDVMEELPDAERRKVLKFVTSTPRAPLLGFGSLNPRFSIRDSGDDDRLPSTSTCVNLLKLPRYKSKESCRRKLLQAVNAGAGFDLS